MRQQRPASAMKPGETSPDSGIGVTGSRVDPNRCSPVIPFRHHDVLGGHRNRGAVADCGGPLSSPRARQWQAQRNRHRVLGEADATRTAIIEARERFEHLIATGGQSKRYFTAEENQQTGRRLRDAADRTTDPSLGTLTVEAAARWDTAFGHAPPAKGPRMIVNGGLAPSHVWPIWKEVGEWTLRSSPQESDSISAKRPWLVLTSSTAPCKSNAASA